jgi:hypothetical protein
MSSGTNPDMPKRVGRRRRWHENMESRFAEGTFVRMLAVLEPKETKTDLVRAAVERELARREAAAGRRAKRRKTTMK